MDAKRKLNFVLTATFLLFPAIFHVSKINAEIIRFNFNTESYFNRTDVSNGLTHNSDGSGNAAGNTGLNGSVFGSIDINRTSTGEDTINDYFLHVVMPHGIAPGFNFPQWTVQYSSSTIMQPGSGAIAEIYSNGYMSIQQEFLFDPYYGPATPQNTWYDPNLRQEYLFRVDLQISSVEGAGPNSSRGFAIDRVDVRCAVPGDARLTCNGFGSVGGSNYSDWSSTEGLASSFEISPSEPLTPPSLLSSPSTLLVMLSTFGLFFVSRKQRYGNIKI